MTKNIFIFLIIQQLFLYSQPLKFEIKAITEAQIELVITNLSSKKINTIIDLDTPFILGKNEHYLIEYKENDFSLDLVLDVSSEKTFVPSGYLYPPYKNLELSEKQFYSKILTLYPKQIIKKKYNYYTYREDIYPRKAKLLPMYLYNAHIEYNGLIMKSKLKTAFNKNPKIIKEINKLDFFNIKSNKIQFPIKLIKYPPPLPNKPFQPNTKVNYSKFYFTNKELIQK